MVADRLAERWDFPRVKDRFRGRIAEGRIDGVRAALLWPQTYMNEAGRSVGPARGSFKLPLGARPGRARRDRPALRRCAHAPRWRPGRSQRPEVDQARVGRRRLHARESRCRASQIDRPRDRLRVRARALSRAGRRGQRPDRPGMRGGRACPARLRGVRGGDVCSKLRDRVSAKQLQTGRFAKKCSYNSSAPTTRHRFPTTLDRLPTTRHRAPLTRRQSHPCRCARS